MLRLISFSCSFVLVYLLAVMPAFADDTDQWTGVWDTIWTDGGGRITLRQEGDSVSGEFPLYKSRLEGKVYGDRLEGRRIEGERSSAFVILLGQGGRSFFGRDDAQGWWTGSRVKAGEVLPEIQFATPREALANFVFFATQARCGLEDCWARAAQSVEFGPETLALPRAVQLTRLREFFDLVDLTTFRIWEVATDAPTGELTLQLFQSRSNVELPVTLRRNVAGEWRVLIPDQVALQVLQKSLLAIYGDNPPTDQSFKKLKSPRDAARSFLEGMANWNGRGKKVAISALDLRMIPEALRESDGALAAGYLCRALHQIGLVGLQSIPNDSMNRDPFVLFEHAEGSIVIAPSGPEPDAPWQFTDGTIETIALVYLGTAGLVPVMETPPGIIPPTPYFTIRSFVTERLPALRARVLRFELWQVIALLILVPSVLLMARSLAKFVGRLIEQLTKSILPYPRWFTVATVVLIAVACLSLIQEPLGIPQRARAYSLPFVGSILSLSMAAVVWHVASLLCGILKNAAEKTRSAVDDLVINLLVGCVRAGIIVGCLLAIAHVFSIPASNVLAGIGIGGLGIAFASRETIAQFFGAAVLVADRPFRAGDWIQSSLAAGVVESVGIRSTRVRTAADSVVVVPNASLASASILNLGKQRPRELSLQILVMQGATFEKVERFIATLRNRIAANPAFLTSRTTIGVAGIVTNGIQIKCDSSFDVHSDQEEAAARHDFLVEVMAVAEKEGLGLGPQFVPPTTATTAKA